MIHHRRRVDQNQAEIVKALRDEGAVVFDLSPVGKGIPDILVLHNSRCMLAEIKNPSKPRLDRALTPAQVRTHAEVAGTGCVVTVLHSVNDALMMILE